MTATLDCVDWNKYVPAYDGTDASQQRVVQTICADYGLDANAVGPIVETVLRALHRQQHKPNKSLPSAPDVDALARHHARSAHITRVVTAAIEQGLLHDENPVVNLYNWDAYHARLANLHDAFPGKEWNHAVAVKSNPVRGVLREAQRLGFGAECASIAEAKHALSLGFAPRTVVYDSPCKTLGELREMVRAGVFINLDNEQEIEKVELILAELRDTGIDHDINAQIGLRINPVVGGGSIEQSSTATVTSKFGLPWTSATHDRLLALFANHAWLQGVHVHVGSQGCPLDLLVAGAKRAVEFATQVNARRGAQQIKVVDIGGGVPTVYDGGVTEAYDFHVYANALRTQVPQLFTSGFTSIITEFGRAIFVKPGVTVSKVEALKDWAGQNIAVVHVGADQFLRTAFLPDVWPHTLTVLDRHGHVKTSKDLVLHDIAGPLCFSGDFIAKRVWLPQIQVGDYLVIHDTGGYTLSMFSKYNSRQAPSVHAYSTKTDGSIAFACLKTRETTEEALSFWGIDTTIQL